MSRPARSRSRGFTLVELLVTVLILGIVGTALVNTIITALQQNQTQTQLQASLVNARVAFEQVASDVRTAEAVNAVTDERLQVRSREGDRWALVTYELVDDGDGALALQVTTADDGEFLGRPGTAITTRERVLIRGLGPDSRFAPFDIGGNPPAPEAAIARVDVRLAPALGDSWIFQDSASVRTETDLLYR